MSANISTLDNASTDYSLLNEKISNIVEVYSRIPRLLPTVLAITVQSYIANRQLLKLFAPIRSAHMTRDEVKKILPLLIVLRDTIADNCNKLKILKKIHNKSLTELEELIEDFSLATDEEFVDLVSQVYDAVAIYDNRN